MNRFKSMIWGIIVLLSASIISAHASGDKQFTESEEAINDPKLMTLDQAIKRSLIPTKKAKFGDWRESGATCLLFSSSKTVKGGKDLMDWNPITGEKKLIFSAEKFIPEGSDKALNFSSPVWSPDRTKLLLYTNTKRVWRAHSRGDYWVLDLKTFKLRQLGPKFEPSTLMFAKFSPDSTRVAYVQKNNVYVEDLKNDAIKKLTTCETDYIVNGTVDWAYEEEFQIRDGFKWSPDSKSIAYFQFDTEGVGTFHLVNYLDSNYSKVIDLPYPKVGTTNSACRVGVVKASGGKTVWLDKLPGESRMHYIPRFYWAGNSKSVVLQRMNRLQNVNRLWMATLDSGLLNGLKVESLEPFFEDKDKTWVYVNDHMTWFDEGNYFLWFTEMDGWRHFYRISRDGKEKTLITKGDFDVIKLLKMDTENGWLYYSASPDNPLQVYLYRERLDGTGQPERLTPASQNGTHEYKIAGDASHAFHSYSSLNEPGVYELVSLPDHKTVKMLEDNAEARKKMKQVHFQPTEFFSIEIEPGVKLPAAMIKPYNFDPSKKYPVLVQIYGEPMGQRLKDIWAKEEWCQYLAQRGYISLFIENRGTNYPLGRDWRHFIYRKVGILAPIDQANALIKAKEMFPFIDGDRIGVTGFSGGGSMSLNLLFRYPELYNTAMAGGFISNQLLYDSIYQERFMGMPDDNGDNYRDGSPMTHVKNLEGNLLIFHGTQDDNCHYQSFENLVNELIRNQKMFTAVPYTGGTHSIGLAAGRTGSEHLLKTKTWYLKNHIKAGPLDR